jgi:molecular chaperone DnaK
MMPAAARFESTDEKVKGAVIGIDLGKSQAMLSVTSGLAVWALT